MMIQPGIEGIDCISSRQLTNFSHYLGSPLKPEAIRRDEARATGTTRMAIAMLKNYTALRFISRYMGRLQNGMGDIVFTSVSEDDYSEYAKTIIRW